MKRRPMPRCATCGCEIGEIEDHFRRKWHNHPGTPEIAWCGEHKEDADDNLPILEEANQEELEVLLSGIAARGDGRVVRRRA